MDFMKVFDQTVREIKREVNLKVLKVPEIEQKVLDATSDEPWGPHGTALSELAHATKKFTECQMVMNVLWTRLAERGSKWRHVYKALAIIEYLIANGSERAVDDILDHYSKISVLSSFEYMEPNGKDAGINVRKKVETILGIINDKERIKAVREKAASNRDKYVGLSSTGITYKSSSASFGSNYSSGERYGSFSGTREADSFGDSYRDKEPVKTSASNTSNQKSSSKIRKDAKHNRRYIGDVYLKRPEYNKEPLHSKFWLRETLKKPTLSSEPAIAVHQIQPNDQFVIFASDGLWEHLGNQEAADLVRSNPRNLFSEPFTIRISCGSFNDVRTAPTNTLWYRDFGYTGGRFANATRPSFIIPPLKTLRYFPLSDGPENCYYINNVPNGHYQVRLFFALVADPNLGSEPIFDVSVEGTLFSSLLLGWSSDDEKTFAEALVFVQDSSLSICFHSTGHGDPSILSIEVLQIDDNAYNFGPPWGKGTVLRTAKRLTCGSGKPAFDEDLNSIHWGGDRFWLGLNTMSSSSDDQPVSTENVIAETLLAPNFYPQSVYQSAIVGTDRQSGLSFEMDVTPNKNYSVWLHFAEIENGITAEEERVFDVFINGDTAFKDIDIIRMTGERFTALVLNKTVAVSGTTLKIILQPVKGTRAIISAIEVFEIIPVEMKTLTQEVSALRTLKGSLGLPLRFGWNGDPCVPQQHPWSGVDCQFDDTKGHFVINGLNLSGNSIKGNIPFSLGTISGLQVLDMSYNELNGSIPESLGQLTSLQILNLNGNDLSGRVPASLGGRPLHRARFNFTDNAGLCGIPGLRECGPHLSVASKIGMAFGVLVAFLFLVVFAACWWKRRQNILRARKLAAAREAPYAKSRTQFTRDVQMAKHHHPHESSRSGNNGSSPHLLS